jgi:hypothetical protein
MELADAAVYFDVPTGMWRLKETYLYEGAGFGFAVPAGFLFDLASIPRSAWWAIAPFELSIVAPLLHDYLYRSRGRPAWILANGKREVTRKEADTIFSDVMLRTGVPAWRRTAAFQAVRLFGWRFWGRAQ